MTQDGNVNDFCGDHCVKPPVFILRIVDQYEFAPAARYLSIAANSSA